MSDPKGTILIVDDVPTNLSVLMNFLQNNGYKVLVATDGEEAIEQAVYTLPDAILLDVMMPQLDGFQTCRQIKKNPATRDIPIIFMTALSDTQAKIKAFEAGAADYITKPLQQEEVVARVNAHITVYRQRREIERLREIDRQNYESLSQYKDHLLNTASHDLKNPLAAIMASVSILRRYVEPEDTRFYERLQHIQDASLYMRDLICNLLDLAQIETGIAQRKEYVSLTQLTENSVNQMGIFAGEKNIRLDVSIPQETSLNCDAFQIGQVLQNLISNAVKYTPSGGLVQISTAVHDDYVRFQVSDNGIGIPENDLPHIFERFYRANSTQHRVISGTGLGLSIVYEIIKQHGGKIGVESTPGQGSTFSFGLPC